MSFLPTKLHRLSVGVLSILAVVSFVWYWAGRNNSSIGDVSKKRASEVTEETSRENTNRKAIAESFDSALSETRQLRPVLKEIEPGLPLQFVTIDADGLILLEERQPSSPPLTIQQLFEIDPLIPQRIQDGLLEENQHLLTSCLEKIVSGSQEEKVVSFDMVLDLEVDGEVGGIRSVGFSEPPNELTVTNMDCIQKSFTSISFDGTDMAFEGPVRYPIRTIARPREDAIMER